MIAMFFQPESPRWLIQKGKVEKARSNLSTLRQLSPEHDYITWEVSTVEKQLEAEADMWANRSIFAKIKECFGAGNRHRLLLGMGLMILQNMSGINALNYYSPTIFTAIGFRGTEVGLLATGVFGLVKAFATLIFMMFFIDKLGRRKSMMIGSAGAILALYYLGGYTAQSKSFVSSTPPPRDAGAYIAILMIYIFAIFYAMSWNGIPWIFW